MEWIENHLGATMVAAAAALGVFALVVRKLGKPALAAWKLYKAAQKKVHETQEKLADGYQGLTTLTERQLQESKRECDELKIEAAALRTALASQVLATTVRDDINRQLRAYIRALKGRMRENRIDFADIEETIQERFGNE